MRNLITKFLVLMMFPLLSAGQMSYKNLGKEKWTFRKKGDATWSPAKVPGDVHTDLIRNKAIVDPFFGANENKLQWIENEEWEYETTFNISPKELASENIDLKFDGIDTHADVYLNGKKLIYVDNMFRTWTLNVKKELKLGANKLYLHFKSSTKIGLAEAAKYPYEVRDKDRAHVRKAQYHFGWDWGPRYVTAGIWKQVKLNFWESAQITNVKCNQKSLTDKLAQLEFVTDIKATKAGKKQIKINNKIETVDLKVGKNTFTTKYEITNPKRWWVHNLGKPHLYPFAVSLVDKTKVLDKKDMNVGLRTIELIQEKDAIGTSFYFKLNGVPVFMKGASYIPVDSFLPRANDSVYKSVIKAATDANMNMLRVWGGGVYGDDVFYDLCDKNGVMVWQDFMFACTMYPGDKPFLDNVKQEVIDNVNRIQNHPSLALYCGNNEVDEGWKNWGWQKQYKYTVADSTKLYDDYKKLFNDLIPNTLDSLLTKDKNIYWPSSPLLQSRRPGATDAGDMHNWAVWADEFPYEKYEELVGRFMSEYGLQSMPQMSTIRKFAKEEDLNLDSEPMKVHQKHTYGKKLLNLYVGNDYKIPKKFEDFVYATQLVQAKGIKFAMNKYRFGNRCMGSLYWQINDCWPVSSWSSMDYYGNWKALHYQAKNSYDNVLVAVDLDRPKGLYHIFVSNHNLSDRKGKLNMQIVDFSGKELWSKNMDITAKPNGSETYYTINRKDIAGFDLKNCVLNIDFVMTDGEKRNEIYFFEKPKDMVLKKPNLKVKNLDATTIEISTDILAKDVYLMNENVFFSDNYFDILPNKTKIIKVSKPVKDLKIKTLFDTL
jgi:beta-mannosidase